MFHHGRESRRKLKSIEKDGRTGQEYNVRKKRKGAFWEVILLDALL